MHYRVSPRNLGQMLLDPFCERCYFYQVKMGFKLPFDRPMPGIMFHLDNFEKALVETHAASKGELPTWLKELDCVTTVDFPSKMTQEFPKYDITLVGMPDAVFERSDGKLCLVDFKTAIAKGDDDPFMPTYETQLLGYTHLLEANNIGKVGSAAIVYFENQAKTYSSSPLDLLTEDGFNMPFSVHIHQVNIDRAALEPLLKHFCNFANMRSAPEGLEKCKECARLEQLFKVEQDIRNMEDSLRCRDQFYRLVMHPKIQARRERAKLAWDLTQDDDIQPSDLHFFDSVPLF